MRKKITILLSAVALCSATVWATETQPADTNGDGKVSKEDATLIYDYIFGKATESTTLADVDVNGDGKVNTADVVAVYYKMRAYLEGYGLDSDDSEFGPYNY